MRKLVDTKTPYRTLSQLTCMPFLMGSQRCGRTVKFTTKLALIFTDSLGNLGLERSLQVKGSTTR